MKTMTPSRIDNTHYRKHDFLSKLKKRWESLNIDGIVSPCSYHCSFRSSEAQDLSFVYDYYMFWNLMNCPTGVIPVTEVKEDE